MCRIYKYNIRKDWTDKNGEITDDEKQKNI